MKTSSRESPSITYIMNEVFFHRNSLIAWNIMKKDHHRSQTLKSDEAKWPKMTKMTLTSSFFRGVPMIWTKTDEATASSASIVATAMKMSEMYALWDYTLGCHGALCVENVNHSWIEIEKWDWIIFTLFLQCLTCIISKWSLLKTAGLYCFPVLSVAHGFCLLTHILFPIISCSPLNGAYQQREQLSLMAAFTIAQEL